MNEPLVLVSPARAAHAFSQASMLGDDATVVLIQFDGVDVPDQRRLIRALNRDFGEPYVHTERIPDTGYNDWVVVKLNEDEPISESCFRRQVLSVVDNVCASTRCAVVTTV